MNSSSNKVISLLKDFFYALISNGLTFVISAVMALLLPKFLSVEDFGFYQLYIFYMTYASIFAFGWPDGIYLRIRGKSIDNIDNRTYGTQFYLFTIFEVFVYIILVVFAGLLESDLNKLIVLKLCCISGFIFCVRLFLNYILQGTGNIKKYSFVIIIEKLIFIVLSILLILFKFCTYYYILFADIIAKIISLVIAITYCKKFALVIPKSWKSIKKEIFENIFFASILIVGVAKFAVQNRWSITVFSKVSFAFSISNMLMQFVGAVSIALFPALRRIEKKQLSNIYSTFRSILMIAVLGMLNFYWIGAIILCRWLPEYIDSLRYAIILIPICVYESKMSMVVNTYYKTLRLEQWLMKINFLSMCLSLIMTVISAYYFNSIILAVVSIFLALAIRCIIGEIVLSRKIDIYVIKHIILELVVCCSFILGNWFFGVKGEIIYFAMYVMYILLTKDEAKKCISFIASKVMR